MRLVRKLGVVSVVMAIGCGGENEPRKQSVPPPPTVNSPGPGESGSSDNATAKVAPQEKATEKSAAGDGWGTVKGRLVWNGEAPERPALPITKDQDYCKAKGEIRDETWVVDDKTKGIANCVIYVRKPRSIHPTLPQTVEAVREADESKFKAANGIGWAEVQNAIQTKQKKAADLKADAILDQIRCQYVPHTLALREGQRLLVLNPEDVAHNVKSTSPVSSNEMNANMPPNTVSVATWKAAAQPVHIECSIHTWMNGYAMVFEHPYFAISKPDGSFEIKNVPAGTVSIAIQAQSASINPKGGKGTPRGADFQLAADGILDLGEIKFSK